MKIKVGILFKGSSALADIITESLSNIDDLNAVKYNYVQELMDAKPLADILIIDSAMADYRKYGGDRFIQLAAEYWGKKEIIAIVQFNGGPAAENLKEEGIETIATPLNDAKLAMLAKMIREGVNKGG